MSTERSEEPVGQVALGAKPIAPACRKMMRCAASMREYLKSWFPFRGRIGRRQYWISTLLYSLVWVLGTVILVTLAALNYNPPDDTITGVTIVGFVLLGIAMIVFVVVIVTGLAYRPHRAQATIDDRIN